MYKWNPCYALSPTICLCYEEHVLHYHDVAVNKKLPNVEDRSNGECWSIDKYSNIRQSTGYCCSRRFCAARVVGYDEIGRVGDARCGRRTGAHIINPRDMSLAS